MVFTNKDIEDIQFARDEGGDVWNNELLNDLRARIKQFYRSGDSEVCCYCRRDLQDEFNMVIDIEHILPKSKYSEYMFELGNLNISCKRCNMKIKKEKDDFLVDPTSIKNDFALSEQYYFIHPNFDDYKENLGVLRLTIDDQRLTKYSAKTEKGKFTYKYFQLDRLEVNSLNRAQGVAPENLGVTISDQATNDIKDTLEILLSQL